MLFPMLLPVAHPIVDNCYSRCCARLSTVLTVIDSLVHTLGIAPGWDTFLLVSACFIRYSHRFAPLGPLLTLG